MTDIIEREAGDAVEVPFTAFNGEKMTLHIIPGEGTFGPHDDIYIHDASGARVLWIHVNQSGKMELPAGDYISIIAMPSAKTHRVKYR